MITYSRNQVWWGLIDSEKDDAMGGTVPVIIMSNDDKNIASNCVHCVPCKTKGTAGAIKLNDQIYTAVDEVITLPKENLTEYIGTLTAKERQAINDKVVKLLELDK